MAETFNPYAEWLGVRSSSAQPNHYELLRLATFESDQDAILTAANVQMAKVRGIRPAEHVAQWSRVLDELAVAKHCLTDFFEKSKYDATLRSQGWLEPTKSGAPSPEAPPAGSGIGTGGNAVAGAKRSPYMEVTDAAVSNPLPPRIGAGKSAGAGGNPASASPNSAAWQPGTNLLPPGPRVSQGPAVASPSGGAAGLPQSSPQPYAGAAANGWIPPAPAAPPSPVAMPASPAAPKPKLQFPGETVPIAPAPIQAAPTPTAANPPAPIQPPSAPIPPSPAVGFPMPSAGLPTPTPIFPAGMPQPGGAFGQFPRPFPPVPMPGMSTPGAMPPNAVPPNAAAPNAMPPNVMPQQPFAGQFFPGGPMRPGMNPQLQQFTPGTPGVPSFFPHPPAGPNPYPMSMPPPAGMPQYYPQQGYPQQGVPPGFAGNYPPQGMPPQGMPPQAMMPQTMMPQPAAPREVAPAAGGNFLDDVLSGPSRGESSPMDELGFGDAAAPAQSPGGWQSNDFPQPPPAGANPGGFDEAPSPPSQLAEYEPSGADGSQQQHYSSQPRQDARSPQGSRTMLIGGALAAIALLATVLIGVMVLKQNEPVVAVTTPATDGSHEPSATPQHPPATKPPAVPKLPAHDKPNSKNPGSATTPGVKPATKAADKPPAEAPQDKPSDTMPKPEQPAAKPPNPTPENKPSTGLVIQPTTDPTKPKPAKPVAVDPVKAARLNHLLADIRHKLAERDMDSANRLIGEATPLAVTPDQTERVGRMGALVRYVGEFWGAVHDAMEGLKVTDEIDVGTTKAVVVEKTEQSLTIHLGGGNKHFTLRDMPSGFAVALANRWLDPKKPENKVFVGSFYAVDPNLLENDPDAAKQLWNEASAAGVSDGAYLLPLLNPEPAEGDMAGGAADSLPPIPDIKDVDRVTLKVKSEFDDAIVAATSPTRLGELIQKFFDAAESSDDPVRRYVLYVEARDTAAKSGLAKLTIDAIDRMAKEFRIDALDMKADTFSNYPPTTAAGGREVTHAALALVDEAVAAKRMPVASRLAQAAVVAAQVSKGNDLIKRAMQRSKEVAAMADKKMASDPK